MASARDTADSNRPALSYHGKEPTAQMLVQLWTNAEKRMADRTDRIVKCRDLRRFTEKIQLDPDFLASHPEIKADWAVSVLPERESYERDLITKAGSVEPKIERRPLDVTDTAYDEAEEYESYMREVAEDDENGVPFQTFIEKGAEDGEYGIVVLPSYLDINGLPDFYDRLTERALDLLDDEQKAEYELDKGDRRGRYVRMRDGARVPNPAYNRDVKGRKQDVAEKADGRGSFKRDSEKSRSAHDAAMRRYLLQHSASTFRVISALDCYPLLGRGRGQARWSVEGIIERSLLEKEELVERQLGWSMLGNRLVLPRGASWTHAGAQGQFYLYTAYLTLMDEDGDEHPTIMYCVGGASTWWDGTTMTGPEDNSVAIIDLAEEGLRGRFWHYEFGSHTGDDDPNFYGRPALWSFRQRILNIEGLETAAQVTVQLEAYSGSVYKPDAELLKVDPDAGIERESHQLRKPVRPKPGGIEPWAGDVVPFAQARIGPDAWRLRDTYAESLSMGMAVDSRADASSGAALLVASSQGQIAKAHIRNAAIRAYKFCLEADAMIRLGAYKTHNGVRWPILTTDEQPVGHEVRKRAKPVEFDPAWLGDDENPSLSVTYGEEFNLARADLEMNAAERGFRALKHVAAAFGENDVQTLRYEIAEDQYWKRPEAVAALGMMVDARRSMTKQMEALKLQAENKMTKNGLPGAENGIPQAVLNRGSAPAPQPPNGATQGSVGSDARGGIIAGAQTGARAALAAAPPAGQG